ncbi:MULTISPECIES: arginase family protein [unclassified Agromyces]|uniref:arginase family protein n=1 Tax=unclassified Agromyces TaxID=2639701 RepID=UPI0030149E9E
MPVDLIAAPTNLGLRPPEPGAVPGTAKAPEALREAGLSERMARLGARDAGVVLADRYRPDVRPGDALRNQSAILAHTRRLADRVSASLDSGRAPLVIGGDCSLVLGPALALRRRGRFGLAYLDGHGDFRHPGHDEAATTLGGEALAAAVGLHVAAVSDLDGLRPLIAGRDAVQVGCRDDEVDLTELGATLGDVIPAREVRESGAAAAAARVLDVLARDDLDGFWIHVDVDVLDPRWMPAVDSPDPGGLGPDELVALLAALAPRAIGADVAIFDPDLDPDGSAARRLVDVVEAGFARLGSGSA